MQPIDAECMQNKMAHAILFIVCRTRNKCIFQFDCVFTRGIHPIAMSITILLFVKKTEEWSRCRSATPFAASGNWHQRQHPHRCLTTIEMRITYSETCDIGHGHIVQRECEHDRQMRARAHSRTKISRQSIFGDKLLY